MKLRIAILFIALILMLSGCAKKDDGRITIRYMAWGTPENYALERDIIKSFEEKNPDIKVELFMCPLTSYQAKLQIMLASGTAPDIIRVSHNYFPALASKGYFYPIDKYARNDKEFNIKDFFPWTIEQCQYKGELYGVNVMGGGYVLYYNKTMFEKAGIPSPNQLDAEGKWTYEKYVEVARKLTIIGKHGINEQYGTSAPFYLWTIIWSYGGDVISKDFKTCILNSPGTIQAYKLAQDLVWKYKAAPIPGIENMSGFNFESGKVGMFLGWSGSTPLLRKTAKNFEWDVAPVPEGPAGRFTMLSGNQLVITKTSKHKEACWKFLKHFVSPENEMMMGGEYRRCVPSRISVTKDPEYLKADLPPKHSNVFVDSYKYGRVLPIDEKFASWNPEFEASVQLIYANEATPEDAVKWAQVRMNNVLKTEDF